MKNKILLGTGMLGCVMAWAAKDPIIMTVNGVDVPLSEFEYLYHKNSEQQLSAQPIGEYVKMFELYKQKVADARAEGIDTTASYLKDVAQYRHDLAVPYLTDSIYLNKLVDEAFELSKQEAELRHIMLRKTNNMAENVAIRNRVDSLLTVLRNGGNFEELAVKYSQDANAEENKGNVGFIGVMHLPYEMEKASYTLAPGQYSEVVESPVGYHIIMGGNHRPARGLVEAAHIMKMVPPTATREEQAVAKQQIDSLYSELLKDPTQFEMMASTMNDDRGTARNAGRLPRFGAGEMVAEFDSVAFGLNDNEISAPVRTRYGWHIIKKYGSFAPPTREQMKPALLQRFANPQDGRFKMIRDHQTETLAKSHKASLNKTTIGALKDAASISGLDSVFYADRLPMLSKLTLAKIDGKNISVSGLFEFMRNYQTKNVAEAPAVLDNAIESFYNQQLVLAEELALINKNADYKNLLNEYSEGSLLFEVSNRKVWEKASKDKDGLRAFFEKNRQNYKWSEPRVKGILIQTANDSVTQEVRKRLLTLGGDTITRTINKEFPKVAKAEVVLVKKGDNKMVDNLCFGGEKTTPSLATMTDYFIINERQIDMPEDVSDIRGQVTNDYQNYLEELWIEELRSKYPVKVNEKVLKKVK